MFLPQYLETSQLTRFANHLKPWILTRYDGATLKLSLFTPAEAEAITGISATRQRDLRRHGYLPSSDSHARFDAYGLGHLWAFGLLGAQGIGPKHAEEYAEIIGAGIAFNALIREITQGEAISVHREHSGLGGVIIPRFFVLFPDGSEHWDVSVEDALQRGKRDHSIAGAIVVLDQKDLGEKLMERAGRSLTEAD